MEILFWVALVGALYSYFLYPLVLLLLPKRRVQAEQASLWPDLTLIVTAHNEAGRIREKLENCLQLDYPADRFEILVASDASDDGTDAIVEEFAPRGVRLVRAAERKGKEWAQLQAIQVARGAILVFSDVATQIPADSLRRVAEDFQDPRVGAVSSEDRFVSADGSVVGEGLYVRYEMWLRRKESQVRGVVGLSGSFFAARSDVCRQWDILSPSDFNTALNCARLGYVAISDPELLGYYPALRDERREYQRKLRTVLRGITGLMRNLTVLDIARFGLFSVQVWSHKVMRWLVPWFLLLLLIASVELAADSWFYSLMLAGQIAFYALVVGGALSERLRRLTFIKVPYFFVQVNVAIAHASLAFLAGRRVTVWQPSKR
jgi:glycosyltransferase involved in cell wall biosynthesis